MSQIHKIDSRSRTSEKMPTRAESALNAVRENNGPGSREHGPMPPKKPNYLARRAGVLAVGVAGIAAGAGLLNDGKSEAENNPPTTTVVVAKDGDSVWGSSES